MEITNFLYADEYQTNRFSTPHEYGLSQLVFEQECRFADDYAQCAVEGRECRIIGSIDTKPSPFWRNRI